MLNIYWNCITNSEHHRGFVLAALECFSLLTPENYQICRFCVINSSELIYQSTFNLDVTKQLLVLITYERQIGFTSRSLENLSFHSVSDSLYYSGNCFEKEV